MIREPIDEGLTTKVHLVEYTCIVYGTETATKQIERNKLSYVRCNLFIMFSVDVQPDLLQTEAIFYLFCVLKRTLYGVYGIRDHTEYVYY